MHDDPDRPGWASPAPAPPVAGWAPPAPPGGAGPLPPGGAPVGWPPPPPPARGRWRWLWITLAILAALGAAAIVAIVLFVRAVEPPVSAMNDFLRHLQRGRYDEAYAALCDEEQATTPRETFKVAVSGLVRDLDRYSTISLDPVGDRRTVQYTVTDPRGEDTTYDVVMVREYDDWKVCEFFSETETPR